jgi:hypothetical protein
MDVLGPEPSPAAENERGKGSQNQDDALHEKTSVFRCDWKNRFGSSPIPLVMEERAPLRSMRASCLVQRSRLLVLVLCGCQEAQSPIDRIQGGADQ